MGRGCLQPGNAEQTRTPGISSPQSIDNGTPVARQMFSTPATADNDTLAHLRDLLGELGTHIDNTVVSRILANQTSTPKLNCPPPMTPHSTIPFALPLGLHSPPPMTSPPLEPMPSPVDMSRLNIMVKAAGKEPVMFRGDGSDKYTVQEWIEVMDTYLHKNNCPTSEQADEILSHLLGRAKSIVKVGLKSSADVNTHPEVVYDILRRYFSDSPMSSLPMADFYSTHPDANENPVDYWVRLNAAAEHADRYLGKSGEKRETMSAQIAMMFIRNCPNPELSSVFRCKPISKWSAVEVQEAIDEHQREHQARRRPIKAEKFKMVTAAATTCLPVVEELTAMRAGVQEPPTQPKVSAVTSSEAGALERVLSMLEGIMARAASPVQRPTPWTRPTSCRVCGDKTHITREHCMKENRCFGCLEPGHARRDCTRAVPRQTQAENHTPNQGN